MRVRTRTTFPLLVSFRPSPSVQPPLMTPSPRSPTLVTRSISSPQARKFSLPATCPTLPLPSFLVLVWLRELCHPCLVHLRVCASADGNSPTVLISPASHSRSWGLREGSPLLISPSALFPLPFPPSSRASYPVPPTRSHSTALSYKCVMRSAVIVGHPPLPLPRSREHVLSSSFLRPLLMCRPLSYIFLYSPVRRLQGCNGCEMRI